MYKTVRELTLKSIDNLKKYQKGELRLVKTNRPWLDNAGGVLPGSFISILGASFGGKTTELGNLRRDIMNVDLNPEAMDYVSLAHAFEMTNFNLTLKEIKKVTNKTFKEILSERFSKTEKTLVNNMVNKIADKRFYVNHTTGTAKEIIDMTAKFLEEHKDKKICLVSLDHTSLLKTNQDNKKGSIDELIEGFNNLKFIYPNVLYVVLTQANRNILARIKEKSNDMKLRRDDPYATDTLFHISDYLYGLQNAYYLSVEEYRKINPEKYKHLEHRFTNADKNGKVSLYSEGCIFVEVLKNRMIDDLDFIDLYTIELKKFDKSKVKKIAAIVPNFDEPINPYKDIPNISIEDAFGGNENSGPTF